MTASPPSRRRARALSRARVAAAVATLGLILAACGGSGFTYVTSSSSDTYFKVPKGWTVYDAEDLASVAAPGGADTDRFKFVAVFDADPSPSIERDLQTATYPFGISRVRELTAAERDSFSLFALRNEFVSIDRIVKDEIGELSFLKDPESIVQKDGLAGNRLVYSVQTDEGSWSVDQIGLVDPNTRFIYFFLIGCEASCFAANRSTINEIADSWTVKES